MIQTPKINLMHGDCLELMRDTPSGFYDLAVVDPDFGLNEKISSGGTWAAMYKKGDGDLGGKPTDEYFEQLFRVSKNQIIWGGNYFGLPATRCVIAWDKVAHMDTMADFEMAWTSFDLNAKIVQELNKSDNGKIHPTQKPVALYKWLLQNYAKPGDKILDTHLGSMSIAIACFDLGFDLTGTELDKDYYDAGVARFERHRAQGQLFHAPATQLPEQQKMF